VKANLKSWMNNTYVETPLLLYPGTVSKYYEPLGTVLIIGSWNYPFSNIFTPLISAIASGNTAIMKPSEMAVESAKLVEKMVHEALDNDCYRVVNGAKQTSVYDI